MERIKQQLEEARKKRGRIQRGYTTSTEGLGHRKQNTFRTEKSRFIILEDNNMKLLLGMAALIVAIIITWWSVSDQEPSEIRLSDIDRPEAHQTSATGSMAANALEVKIIGLSKHIDVLTYSITRLESKLTNAHLATDSIIGAANNVASIDPAERQAMAEAEQLIENMPPPAAGQTGNTVEGDQSSTRKPLDTEKKIAAIMEPHEPVTNTSPAVSGNENSPWVINLVSTPSKADADRIAKKASSRGMQTEQQQTTVKSTQYWRVQITGFSTVEDARAYADIAKEKMGLKDVWIMKN